MSVPLNCKATGADKERNMGPMYRTTFIIVILLVTVVVGGGVFLATWDIPAPSEKVEKVLPDKRFPR
ncbi:MAG: hypothetical protein HN725_07480 [Alphaproteobacteria bacterium]|nr:hypothetical protein [Alphaproteobacteria bacterium]MBT4082479.1 hypothetical protein [Alphaproteobacteria bacterium]MBT4545677.1 hypothetical protein [Alphaproteobacteria bacterium]MBT7745117.1 hypothetical protein [Alphaproteobacteria bacterium]